MQHIELATLLAFARQGWRRAAAQRAATFGLLALYWVILFIFWGLWRATSSSELAAVNMDPAGILRYLIVTECVALSVGAPFRGVEAEINNGDIAAGWLRPVPYAWATLSEWLGQTLHRLSVLAVGGVIAGTWITGHVPIAPAILLPLAVSVVFACAAILLCQLQIGYAAAWLTSSTPLFWIWQKLLFVFGGLLIPLSIYPPALRQLSLATPFASMLFAPASMVFAPRTSDIVAALACQIAWLAALCCTTWLVDRAVAARFAVRGI